MTKRKTAFILISSVAISSAAENKSATNGMEKCQRVEASISAIQKGKRFGPDGVQELYQVSKINPGCSDGFFGEGISDVVVKSLVNNFNGVINLACANIDIGDFIIEHIDATADWDDLDKITAYAKKDCPHRATKYCMQLKKVGKKASQDAKKVKR